MSDADRADNPLAMVMLPPLPIRWHRCAKLAAALLAFVALAAKAASGAGFSAAAVETIESCVDASSPIRFASGERRGSLEESDAAEVAAALLKRYPAAAQTGIMPDGIVLWAKPGSGWVYVALITNPAKPDDVCFVATFVAGRFEFTKALSRKYFGVNV